MATRWSLTIDCTNPTEVARFWALALGYAPPPPPDGFDSWAGWLEHHDIPEDEWDDAAYLRDPDSAGPRLSFLEVPESKVVKNRLHLDVQAGGGRDAVPWEQRWPRVRAAADRLVAAGGAEVRVDDMDGRPDHIVMEDPEGNEFCVV